MFGAKITQVFLFLLPTQNVRPLEPQSREVLELRQVIALSRPATAAMLPGRKLTPRARLTPSGGGVMGGDGH